jgi:ABC-type transport system substrate-binding protein
MRQATITVMAGLVLLALLLTWGGAGRIHPGRTSTAEVEAPPGLTVAGVRPAVSDVLRISYSDDPETLNPITAADATASLFQSLVYEQLADHDFEQPDRLVPVLAKSWTFDPQSLVCTIQLRRGVQWQAIALPNGTLLPPREMTSRDVKFTFDCILNPHIDAALKSDFLDPTANSTASAAMIEVETPDDYTVVVRWLKPYFLAEETTLLVGIIPRHVFSVDENGDLISLDFSSREFAEGLNRHWAGTRMCGTGPLQFVEWNRNERLVLKRNSQYWGEPFYFSRIVFNSEPNVYTLLQKLLQGEIDWADIDEKDLYLQARKHPAVQSGAVVLREYEYPGYKYIGYNLRRPFLRDKAVRRALAHAIPVQAIIDSVYRGLARQVTGPFQLHSFAYNEQVKPLPYDLERARRLLNNAGWIDTDRDGVRDKLIDGRRVSARFNLLIEANSAQSLTVAQIVQSNCRKIGVRVDITPAQQALMVQRTRAKDFDAVLRGWALSWTADPYQTWFSGQAELADTSNIIGYKNTEVDRLVQELRTCFDRDRQREIYHRVHELLYDDQPYLFLYTELQTAGINHRIHNVKFFPIKPCVDYRQWYSETEP